MVELSWNRGDSGLYWQRRSLQSRQQERSNLPGLGTSRAHIPRAGDLTAFIDLHMAIPFNIQQFDESIFGFSTRLMAQCGLKASWFQQMLILATEAMLLLRKIKFCALPPSAYHLCLARSHQPRHKGDSSLISPVTHNRLLPHQTVYIQPTLLHSAARTGLRADCYATKRQQSQRA